MSNEKIKNIYSDEVKLALLEQSINSINQTLIRFESRFDQITKEIKDNNKNLESRLDVMSKELKSDSRSNFFWVLGSILGLYGTAFVTLLGAVGKAYHWF